MLHRAVTTIYMEYELSRLLLGEVTVTHHRNAFYL